MVGLYCGSNEPLQYVVIRAVLPTAPSPQTTNFNGFCDVNIERIMVDLFLAKNFEGWSFYWLDVTILQVGRAQCESTLSIYLLLVT